MAMVGGPSIGVEIRCVQLECGSGQQMHAVYCAAWPMVRTAAG